MSGGGELTKLVVVGFCGWASSAWVWLTSSSFAGCGCFPSRRLQVHLLMACFRSSASKLMLCFGPAEVSGVWCVVREGAEVSGDIHERDRQASQLVGGILCEYVSEMARRRR